MTETIAILAVQTLALHIFFRWMEPRVLPRRPAVDLSHLGPEERRRKAYFAYRVVNFTCLLILPGLALAWYFLVRMLPQPAILNAPGAAHVLTPEPPSARAVALIAGVALCGPIGMGALRGCVGGRYRETVACAEEYWPGDTRRILYAIFVWVVPLCLDWELLHANCYTVFGKDAIVVKDFWEPRAIVHRYDDVARIDGVRDYRKLPGAVFPKPDYRIVFKDGGAWVLVGWKPRRPADDRALIERAARRSHRAIRWVAAID